MGREAIGIVQEAGSSMTRFKVGDRVVIPDLFTGHADLLIYGEGNGLGTDLGGCQGMRNGVRLEGSADNDAAEFVKVPLAHTILFGVPQGTEHELDYLLCSDIFATAWHSVTGSGF
jgi:threonine dehydrogenase-like Zn-dependent dehydrogenase